MKARPFGILVFLFSLLIALGPCTGLGATSTSADPENTIHLDIPAGRVVIELLPEKAPNHVARIKELTRQGFYDELAFHRVIPGFMAQTGDPRADGTGGTGQTLKAEFSDEPHIRGTVSMARTDDPDSADSQFFICLAPARFLDGRYTVWGKVIAGMEYIDKIQAGTKANNGAVANPTKIVRMRVAADGDQ